MNNILLHKTNDKPNPEFCTIAVKRKQTPARRARCRLFLQKCRNENFQPAGILHFLYAQKRAILIYRQNERCAKAANLSGNSKTRRS